MELQGFFDYPCVLWSEIISFQNCINLLYMCALLDSSVEEFESDFFWSSWYYNEVLIERVCMLCGATARTDFIGPSLSVISVTGLSRIHEVNVIYVYFYTT